MPEDQMFKWHIVVTCRNYEQFLTRCLHSICANDISNYVITVVDDESDNEAAVAGIVHAFQALGEPIHLIRHVARGGAAMARNTGIASQESEYVCCVDADDTIGPTYLKEAEALFVDAADIVYPTPHYLGDPEPLRNALRDWDNFWHAQIVHAGGVRWKCKICSSYGVIRETSPISQKFRDEHNKPPGTDAGFLLTGKLAVRGQVCPACARQPAANRPDVLIYGELAKITDAQMPTTVTRDVPWLCRICFLGVSTCFRRAVWSYVDGFDTDPACDGWEDWDFWFRVLAHQADFVFCHLPGGHHYFYNRHHGSVSARICADKVEMSQLIRQMYQRHSSLFKRALQLQMVPPLPEGV